MIVFANSFHSILVVIVDKFTFKIVLSITDNHGFYYKNTDFIIFIISFSFSLNQHNNSLLENDSTE